MHRYPSHRNIRTCSYAVMGLAIVHALDRWIDGRTDRQTDRQTGLGLGLVYSELEKKFYYINAEKTCVTRCRIGFIAVLIRSGRFRGSI